MTSSERLRLENASLAYELSIAGGVFRIVAVENKLAATRIELAATEAFRLVGSDGHVLSASELTVADTRASTDENGRVTEIEIAFRRGGWGRTAAARATVDIVWRARLRDGRASHYVRQELTVTARDGELPLANVVLVQLPVADALCMGTVDGVPLTCRHMFFAVEHPMARATVGNGQASLSLRRPAPLRRDGVFTVATSAGVSAPGQLRRAFAAYVERERAHPHRTFLHYNSWFDVSWAGKKLTEAECVGAVQRIGAELVTGRGLGLDAFVFDDGWDDHTTLWQFDRANLPNGFAPVAAAAAEIGSGLGTWISPWGGYDPAKPLRVAAAQRLGFEVTPEGLSLADPGYCELLRRTASTLVQSYRLRYLKLDGITAHDLRQTEALLSLVRDLRAMAPEIFVNLTVGTWASPFWLWHGDATWRGGDDMGFAGTGEKREQWITYRDAETYKNVVRRSPYYPLASVMSHGIVNGQHGPGAALNPNAPSFAHEVRSYFASGVGLQELYITPSRMSGVAWDLVAEAARWARAHVDTLRDTHWVGGDPGAGEVYGWASYGHASTQTQTQAQTQTQTAAGILALRAPSDSKRTVEVTLRDAFELPEGAPRRYRLIDVFAKGAGTSVALEIDADVPQRFELDPFEVRVLEARPVEP